MRTRCQGAGVAGPEGETWRIWLWRVRRDGLIPGGSVVSGEVRRNRGRTSAPSWAFFRPQRPNSCRTGKLPRSCAEILLGPFGTSWMANRERDSIAPRLQSVTSFDPEDIPGALALCRSACKPKCPARSTSVQGGPGWQGGAGSCTRIGDPVMGGVARVPGRA